MGTAVCFWLNAFSYFPVIAALLMMRPVEFYEVPPPARGSVARQLAEGLGYVVRTPAVFGIFVVIWTLGAFGFNFITFLPLLARYVLETGAEGYVLLSSCLGFGALLAVLVVAGRGGPAAETMLRAAAGFTIFWAWWPWPPGTSRCPPADRPRQHQHRLQRHRADAPAVRRAGQFRGRVMSLYTVMFAGMTPLGAITIGGLSESFGVRVAMLIATSSAPSASSPPVSTFARAWEQPR